MQYITKALGQSLFRNTKKICKPMASALSAKSFVRQVAPINHKLVFDLGRVLYSDGTKEAEKKLNQANIVKYIIDFTFYSETSNSFRKGAVSADDFWAAIEMIAPNDWQYI